LTTGAVLSFGLAHYSSSEFELMAEELLMSNSVIKVSRSIRHYFFHGIIVLTLSQNHLNFSYHLIKRGINIISWFIIYMARLFFEEQKYSLSRSFTIFFK
jgi:hypothetical protein